MEEKKKKPEIDPAVKYSILILATIVIHFVSLEMYFATHAAEMYTTLVASELIIDFSILVLWIGYAPLKRIWLKSIIAIIILILHWFLMPTY